tara:strand:+ start:22 stop:273 length:252 start_codon:yes stop_codon:yes gene_type:complete
MAWAIKQKSPTKAKFLLIILANYADENGHCWPAISTLCKDTGMPRSTVKLYLTRLEDMALIKKVQRSRAAVKTSNLYTLIIPK